MASSKKPTRRQHFVPRWYLRNFATRDHLYAFDKEKQRSFKASPSNIGLEKDLYTLPFEGPDAEPIAEEALAIADKKCARTVRKVLGRIEYYVSKFPDLRAALLRGETYSVLTPRDQATLAYLIVLQNSRTPTHRLAMEQAHRALFSWTKKLYKELDDVDWSSIDPDAQETDEVSRHVASLFSKGMAEAAATVASYSFVFQYNRGARPFYTSDHPVVQRDLTEMEPGELPFPIEGFTDGKSMMRFSQRTAFYFPLSSRVLLLVLGGSRGGELPDLNGRVLSCEDGGESDGAQVLYSRRQIYCERDEFDFARKVLVDFPDACSPDREFATVQPFDEYLREVRGRMDKKHEH